MKISETEKDIFIYNISFYQTLEFLKYQIYIDFQRYKYLFRMKLVAILKAETYFESNL